MLLELLLRGDFPAVHVPCPASREVLSLLRYRHWHELPGVGSPLGL